jgi:hypothetical protein
MQLILYKFIRLNYIIPRWSFKTKNDSTLSDYTRQVSTENSSKNFPRSILPRTGKALPSAFDMFILARKYSKRL